MKKLFGILLSFTMLLSVLPLSAFATDKSPIAISAGETINIDLQDAEYEFLEFTPTESCKYVIESTGEYDTFVSLYDSGNKIIESNDDGGDSLNFKLTCQLNSGETYYFRVSGYDEGSIFNVTLTAFESSVKSIIIDDVNLIEGVDSSIATDYVYDEESCEWGEVEYLAYYSYEPKNVVVNFKDGTTFEGSVYELSRNYGENVYYDATQNYNNQWIVGNTYQVEFEFMGYKTTFNVNIIDTPVLSITAPTIKVVNEFDGDWVDDRYYDTEDGEFKDVTFFSYGNYNLGEITVEFKDGTSFTGSVDELYYEFGYQFNYTDYQRYIDRWTVGNTYDLNFEFMGYQSSFKVSVVENMVQSIEIDKLQIIEHTGGEWTRDTTYNIEEDNYYETEEYYVYNNIIPEIVTINFQDGTSFTGTPIEIEETYGYDITFNCNQNYNNQWTVNNTYEAGVSFWDYSGTYQVEIITSPIISISIPTVSLYENVSGAWNSDWEYNWETDEYEEVNKYFIYQRFNVNNVTINFKDGTSFTGSFNDIADEFGYMPQLITYQSYQNPWILGGTYEVSVSIIGFDTKFCVTIIENPVESFEVPNMVVLEHTCGHWVNDWVYDIVAGKFELVTYYVYSDLISDYATYKVHLKNGEVITATADELYEMFNEIPYAPEIHENSSEWISGRNYNVTILFMGIETSFKVEIVEPVLGDLDGNGELTANDYAMIVSFVECDIVLTKEQILLADVNKDGVVDGFDAIQIDCYLNSVCDIYGHEY